MQTRGSLSISTNAIVVLIIAVVMLGLIMGLVGRAFGTVEDQLLNEIQNQQREPANPSPSQPITLSVPALNAQPGEITGFKAKIRNTLDAEHTFRPIIECFGDDDESQMFPTGIMRVQPKPIPSNGIEQFIVLAELDNGATADTTLCTVKAQIQGSSGSFTTADIRGTEITLNIED